MALPGVAFAATVARAPFAVVRLIQGISDRHLGEPVATEPAHLAFNSAFFMSPGNAGLAMESIKAVVGTEQHSPVVLRTLRALPEHDRGDRSGEVVNSGRA